MRKAKINKQNNKNIRLGLYFGLVVFFIILISFTFKVFDNIKKSTFDGNNFYSVVLLSGDNAEIISVSPRENSIKKLTIKGAKTENSLRNLGVPYDSLASSKSEISISPKSFFTKILFRKNDIESNLTAIDLIKLSIFSNKISSENVITNDVSINDENIKKELSEWFLDPEIVKEEYKIEIVNATKVSGLGGRFADLITNAGGNVVLVHSSQDEIKESKIYYVKDSYTVDKISKLLNIPTEKKELNSVSDIIIQVGDDRKEF